MLCPWIRGMRRLHMLPENKRILMLPPNLADMGKTDDFRAPNRFSFFRHDLTILSRESMGGGLFPYVGARARHLRGIDRGDMMKKCQRPQPNPNRHAIRYRPTYTTAVPYRTKRRDYGRWAGASCLDTATHRCPASRVTCVTRPNAPG